jgi:hypothetical protein
MFLQAKSNGGASSVKYLIRFPGNDGSEHKHLAKEWLDEINSTVEPEFGFVR